MVDRTRTKQGGSVVNFLIVGVVLAALTLGAIYVVHNRGSGEIASSPAPSQTASPSATPSTSSPTPSASSSPAPQASSPAPSSVPATGYHLPETGPTDTIALVGLPLAVVTAASVAYVRSRRLI